MAKNSSRAVGRHFLQIPGPTPVPDRVVRAMEIPLIDPRGPEFAELTKRVIEGIKTIFKTSKPVIMYTATGTGAWESALTNTLSPGDKVLMFETGQFATLWKKMAERIGLKPEFISTDWRHGVDPNAIEGRLREDKNKEIKAVCVLHNETSTGALTPIAEIRKAIDAAGHPALFMVDTISSLASTDYRHDEWGVDVSIGGAQKGLMLPPGMSFNAISDKALAANKTATMPTRRAVRAWGLQNLNQNAGQLSPTITAVMMPDGYDADKFRALALETFNISYGASFGQYAGKYFRIGHLGDINDATMIGALSATEMALQLAGVPIKKGGVQAATDYLVSAHGSAAKKAAE
ncbi:MAG: aminotransferase class V-fold PLP-dependent enzyme [Pseudolabrys sp.]